MANQDIYQSITDRIIDALDKNIIPWRRPWQGGGANAPRNAITNRPYKGMNIWLLGLECALRGFEDPRFLTFNQARQAGAKVMKGAKSCEVLLWKPMLKAKLNPDGSPIIKNGKPVMSTFLLLRTFRVFNVAEVENLKLKEPQTSGPCDVTPIDAAEKIMNDYLLTNGIPVKFGHDHAAYFPTLDMIHMPAREQFNGMPEFYSTMFHEMTHSTGHQDRCKREGIDTFDHFGSDKYAKEELVAEMGNSFLCSLAGIDVTLDNPIAYIQSWKSKLKEDSKLIISAASQAQRASDFILGLVAKEDENKTDDES
jgi:antirestriction protein ArdC